MRKICFKESKLYWKIEQIFLFPGEMWDALLQNSAYLLDDPLRWPSVRGIVSVLHTKTFFCGFSSVIYM